MTKNTQTESSDPYAVPSHQEDVVTTMCRIVEEDAPQPMRNMKKSTKVSNAADQFSNDHHGEYEARARQSCGKIEKVHGHNEACPKMYDELKKKASTSHVVAVTMSRKDALHLTRSNRGTNPVTRHARHKKSKEKSRTIRNKLTKRKKTYRQRGSGGRPYKLTKIWKTKGCQCHPVRDNEEDKIDDVITWARSLKQASRTTQRTQRTRSYTTEKRPGTSGTSVSTYHSSYSSMAQEPMVS